MSWSLMSSLEQMEGETRSQASEYVLAGHTVQPCDVDSLFLS